MNGAMSFGAAVRSAATAGGLRRVPLSGNCSGNAVAAVVPPGIRSRRVWHFRGPFTKAGCVGSPLQRRPDTSGYHIGVIECTIIIYVVQNRPAPPATAALVDAHRDGDEAATGLIEQAVSPNTRDAYAGALRRLSAWLDGRPLDDRSLAAYLGSLHKTGRTPATAALVVAGVRRAAHDANENAPDGPLTRQTLEGFRRTAAAAGAPAHRSLARGLTAEECDAVLAACCRRRRTGSGLEREETAMRRGLIDGAIVALLFHGALRRSEVAALRWADVDLSGDDDVVVTVRRSKTNPAGDRADVRRLVGGCAAAVRRLHAAPTPTPTPTEAVIGLAVHQINRRFAAACAAAGLEGRRTSHSGRVGLAVELTARGASTHDIQIAGGWKDAGMVARYAGSVSTRDGAVRRFMRQTGTTSSMKTPDD